MVIVIYCFLSKFRVKLRKLWIKLGFSLFNEIILGENIEIFLSCNNKND